MQAQLAKHSRPVIHLLPTDGSSPEAGRLLLVDVLSLEGSLLPRCGCAADAYSLAAAFASRLKATGLQVVFVTSLGACGPAQDAAAAARARAAALAGAPPSPAARWALSAALADSGCEVLTASVSAPRLLLAHARRHAPALFAILTDAPDFFVYGLVRRVLVCGSATLTRSPPSQVDSVALLSETIADAAAVTFAVWGAEAAWCAWRRSVQRGARPPSARQKAAVYALLSGAARLPSPALAAALALAAPPEERLGLPFFTEAAGASSFDAPQLAEFNAAVDALLHEAEQAGSGAWQRHALPADGEEEEEEAEEEDGAPARCPTPPSVRALAPSPVAQALSRGLVLLGGAAGEGEAATRALRSSAASSAFGPAGPPGDVYEYHPGEHTLVKLLPCVQSGAGAPPGWFRPEALNNAALRSPPQHHGGDAAPAPPPCDGRDVAAAAAALRAACGSLGGDDASFYAAFLCASSGDAASPSPAPALRSLLRLPASFAEAAGAGGALLDAAEGGASAAAAATPPPPGGRPLVDVGSGLSKADWADLDDKELVARTRAGGSYKVLAAIVPWSVDALAAQPLRAEEAFEYMYGLRKESGTPWRKLLDACFPDQTAAASADKARKKALAARTPALVMEELKKAKAAGGATAAWLEALARGDAPDQLALRRAALRAGPGSVEWAAARVLWAAASPRVRAAAAEQQHACTNKGGPPPGAPPMRYKHQEEILSLVDGHLTASSVKGGGTRSSAPPLRCILSTPTGSGKTFTALLLSLQLLAPKHPGCILVYSVPTKQVLKRVGQECEAHAAVYWTASREGDAFQVRRPYSIRTKRDKGAPKGGAGSGTMAAQLADARARGTEANDRGGGTPSLIIADVYAVAALCAAAAAEPRSSPFHSSRLVLYLDEPNMGIHLSADAASVVKSICACAPHTVVLASATLAPWRALPPWWRGDAAVPTTRVTISAPPVDLPASRLVLLDVASGEKRSVAITELFGSHAEFAAAIAGDPRLRLLLLRHLSPSQANDLLAEGWAPPGCGGEAGAMEAWGALQPDVRTSRETLEACLLRLGPERYASLRSKWREPPVKLGADAAEQGLHCAVSKTGVTMVATLEPRLRALQLAGWTPAGGTPAWAEQLHAMKARRKAGARMAAAAAKEREREDKKGATGNAREEGDRSGASASAQGGGGGDGGRDGAAGLELRPGLVVTHEEASSADDDTLVMLSRGVAFAAADGCEGPLVKRLYQQALLHVPEEATLRRLPPIHALVVDYSSVYGTDCPAVDTLVLCDDLGSALAWDDAQQFLGRLRRDGAAVFTSARTLRSAAAGPAAGGGDTALEEGIESLGRAVRACIARALAAPAASRPIGAKALADDLAAARRAREPHAPTPAELVRAFLVSLLDLAFPADGDATHEERAMHAAPAAGANPAAAALSAVKGLLGAWGGAAAALLRSKGERIAFLRSWEGALVASPRLGPLLGATLKGLYDADALDEDALLAWAASATQRGQGGDAPAAQMRAKAQPIIQWLEEASEEEDD